MYVTDAFRRVFRLMSLGDVGRMRILVAHDDQHFVEPLAAALRLACHVVEAFATSLQAWDALKGPSTVDLLITRVDFEKAPNGIALANHGSLYHRDMRALFIGPRALRRQLVHDLGPFLAMPVSVP